MLETVVTFVVTTCVYGCLALLACRRVAKHLHGNPEAISAVTQHVLMPVFWAADGSNAQGEEEGDEDEDAED
jgi:hypothetical protein